MPAFPFASMNPARVRKDPLGPVSLNQLHANIEAVDALSRVEHFANGEHNALEVPWVLGHVADGGTPTGTVFNTTYGGSTFTRPATGEYTVDVVSGVVTTDADLNLLYSAMASVNDANVGLKPHTITVEALSATSFKLRIRALSSALGAGNTWASVNRSFDFGLHAIAQPMDPTGLSSHDLKQRNGWLTEAATDWSALVQNQGIVRKEALVEHTTAGLHNANRIARAVGWFRPGELTYSITYDEGVSSIAYVSGGIATVTLDTTFSSTSNMCCFVEAQPGDKDELVIINAVPASTTVWGVYTYVFDGTDWARASRPFFAAFYGVPA